MTAAPAQGHQDATKTRPRAAQTAAAHHQHQERHSMAITKHTPVIVTDHAYRALENMIRRGRVDITSPAAPTYLARYLDASMWHSAGPAERRELAAEAVKRRHHANAAARAQSLTKVKSAPAPAPAAEHPHATLTGAPASIDDPCTTVTPGSRYVPCAGGCGALLRRPRACVTRCGLCTAARTRARAAAKAAAAERATARAKRAANH